MAFNAKLTMLVNHATPKGQYSGFSESLYRTVDGLDAGISAIRSLASLRAQLLPAGAQVVGLRCSNVANLSESKQLQTAINGNPSYPTDTVFQTLLCNGRTAAGNQRPFMVRCVPDKVVENGDYVDDGVWGPILNRYLTAVKDGTWLMRVVNRGMPLRRALSVNSAGVVVMLEGLEGAVKSSLVQLYRCKSNTGKSIRGTKYIALLTDILNFTFGNWPEGVLLVSGRMRLYQIIYSAINQLGISRIVKRDTGRPFFLTRGRRTQTK